MKLISKTEQRPRPRTRFAGLGSRVAAVFAVVLATGALGACSSLPSNGPETWEVMRAGKGSTPSFRIVNLNPSTIPTRRAPVHDGADLAAMNAYADGDAVDRIQVGDTLQITVFEVGASLFGGGAKPSPSSSGSTAPAANAETLPPVIVEPDGSVILPYVGRVAVAGVTPERVASLIEAALRGNSQSPQVVVSVREDVGNSVVVMGDIRNPGRKPLNYHRERLLDMIAMAGGPTNDSVDMRVRVTRRDRSFEMALADIVSGSPEDLVLAAQDRIELLYRPRSFTAFGAAGKVSEIPFHTVRLSLAEALARIGGPSDPQADPTGIFIFRAGQPANAERVVYRLNLKDPRSYFVAQNFSVQDKDVIFIANARTQSIQKMLSLIGSIVSPAVTAKYIGS